MRIQAAALSIVVLAAAACTAGQAPSPSDRPSPTVSAVGQTVTPTGTPEGSASSANPLEGTWSTPPTTCELQNAALTKAGFTSDDLQLGGWDQATCGGMMHGSQFKIRIAGDRLVIFQDGTIEWNGVARIVDERTFQAGDDGRLYITYSYALNADQLTVDMVKDDFPTTSQAELMGERIAQTIVYETAPFTREP